MQAKILIIDDNAQDRKAMIRRLKELGIREALQAESAKEGAAIALEEQPEIIIIDTVLPDADGFTVCAYLKLEKKLNCLVILLTGHVDAIDSAQAAEASADHYIVKTSNYKMLLDCLKKHIDGSGNVV